MLVNIITIIIDAKESIILCLGLLEEIKLAIYSDGPNINNNKD